MPEITKARLKLQEMQSEAFKMLSHSICILESDLERARQDPNKDNIRWLIQSVSSLVVKKDKSMKAIDNFIDSKTDEELGFK